MWAPVTSRAEHRGHQQDRCLYYLPTCIRRTHFRRVGGLAVSSLWGRLPLDFLSQAQQSDGINSTPTRQQLVTIFRSLFFLKPDCCSLFEPQRFAYRLRLAGLVLASSLAWSGCATAPEKPPVAAPAVVPLAQMLEQADKSRSDGHLQRAREGYRSAAATYPTEHVPWVRLAQSHFEAADYGNAIVAAEEAVQRSPGDQTALGILAVSGLRVSSRAVSNLSEKQVLGDTRSQAELIVQTLRSVLGEPILVRSDDATPSAASSEKPAVARPARPPIKPIPPAASASTPTPATNAASSKKPTSTANPFEVLR